MKILSVLFLLTSSICLHAQSFERVYPDMEIGSVTSINIHSSGVGYAPQECGVLLKTEDGGETWYQIFPEVSEDAYQGFVVFLDENDPDKLVYYSQYSLVKTDDGFATSENIKPNPISSTIKAFKVMENGDYGLLAHTFLYSSDGGSTWTESESAEVDGIDMNEVNGALYVCYRAILRSTDGGVTFDTVFHNSDTKRKIVDYNGKPIVSSSDHLYTSDDGGMTWEEIPAVDYYGYASNLTVHNNRLISNTSNRINYSDDGGVIWTSVIMPPGVYRTASIFVNDTGRIFIGGEATQIYATDDPQVPLEIIFGNMIELNSITGSGNRLVATGLDGMLMRSEDGGQNWSEHIVTDRNLDLAAFIGDNLFVFNDNDELVFIDDDNSITPVMSLGGDYYTSMEVREDALTAFIGTRQSVIRTDDGGEKWSTVYTHPIELVKLHLAGNGEVMVLDDRGDIYASADDGNTFELAIASPDTNTNYLDFTHFDEMNAMVLSVSRIYVTPDAGDTWEDFFRPYNGQGLYRLNNTSALCLGVNSSAGWLYQTNDRGLNFPEIATTCSTTSRGAYYNEDAQTFWVVGPGLGIQNIDLILSSTTQSGPVVRSTHVYPNPASEVVYLETETSESSQIAVYNVLGSLVMTSSGIQSSLDISGLPSGQYQLVIRNKHEIVVGRFVKL